MDNKNVEHISMEYDSDIKKNEIVESVVNGWTWKYNIKWGNLNTGKQILMVYFIPYM